MLFCNWVRIINYIPSEKILISLQIYVIEIILNFDLYINDLNSGKD